MKTKNLFLTVILSTSFTFVANAQNTTTDFTKAADALPGIVNGSVKVIDNKGTIKFLQAKNGITMLTNTTADKTTTTWQLGGTLTDNTYIDVDGKAFGFDGLKLETGSSSSDATDQSDKGTGTGWTLLVRDEATGETKKLLASSLVSGIRTEYTQAADAAVNVPVIVTGLPVLSAGVTDAKLFVYRNGVKLRTGTDFVATSDTVTITYSAANLPMYAGDIIEVQYIK